MRTALKLHLMTDPDHDLQNTDIKMNSGGEEAVQPFFGFYGAGTDTVAFRSLR